MAVDALASGFITNTAGATATEADPVPGNNVGAASVRVVGVADLSVTKISLPDTVIQDQPMTYVVTVTNLGPGLATGVRLTDTLPADLQNPTYTWSQGACSGTSAVACQVGSLAGDAAATLTITGTVKHGTQTLRNVARVTADQVDGVTGNNTYTLTTNAKQADLSVTKSASPSPAVAGNELTYTVVITNGGPDDATGVVMQDAVSVDLTFVSASAGCSYCRGNRHLQRRHHRQADEQQHADPHRHLRHSIRHGERRPACRTRRRSTAWRPMPTRATTRSPWTQHVERRAEPQRDQDRIGRHRSPPAAAVTYTSP